MGEDGLPWKARLVAIEDGLRSNGQRGFPLPVAGYLGKKYGDQPDCGAGARQRTDTILATLSDRLSDSPYCLGEQLSVIACTPTTSPCRCRCD